jgi:hypothetical protein
VNDIRAPDEDEALCNGRCERATSSVAATAFMANRPWAATATAISVFYILRQFEGVLQDFHLKGLLAQEALQLAYLLLLSPEGRRRDNLLLGHRRGQRTLLGKPPPGEKLVRRHPAPTGDKADRDAGLLRLRHHLQLLRNRPPATPLGAGQNLNLRIRTSHSHNITPNPYFKGETCPGNSGAASGPSFGAY